MYVYLYYDCMSCSHSIDPYARFLGHKQRCHFKKLKKPSWANKKPKKTQGHILIHLA